MTTSALWSLTSRRQRKGRMDIFLGRETTEDTPEVRLPKETFLRHAVCLGASGSGKTVACKVICEEFLLTGVPVIALDPQGDIASMILPGDPEEIAAKGLDPEVATSFHQQVEVVIWTPGSYVGVPLCLDPMKLDGLPSRKSDRIRVLSAIAANLTALLGYSLDSNDGQFTSAYLDLILQYLAENKIKVGDLSGFAAFLDNLPESLAEEAGRVIKESKRQEVGRKVQVLGIGARKLLFQVGAPIDIDVFLNKGDDAEEGVTRLSVIYLNTLHAQEEKEFFISQISQRLYDWMLSHPSTEPQALFYIDEIAPFIPPVRKPACKDVLKMLFKQARKYGISCLIASQNPGDIDYTAMAQFSTWALGRMMVRQDIKKVEQTIRSLAPTQVDETVETLPALQPGQFLLISPDVYDRVVDMKIRWLYTKHETLDEDRVEDLIDDEMREKYGRAPEPEEEEEVEAESTSEEEEEVFEEDADELDQFDEDDSFEDDIELENDKPKTHSDLIREYLSEHPGAYTVKELTHEIALSESLVRKNLKALHTDKKVNTAKVGRSHFYWLHGQRFEPSVGLVRPILTMQTRTDPDDAKVLAERECRSALFGLWKSETVEGPKERHLLLWQTTAVYEKTSGAFFMKSTNKVEKVLYFDARTSRLLLVLDRLPFELVHSTEMSANELGDLPDQMNLTPHTPGELKLQTRTLKACKSPEAVVEQCRKIFSADCKDTHMVAMPYWEFTLCSSDGKTRPVCVDGLYGRVFTIPTR